MISLAHGRRALLLVAAALTFLVLLGAQTSASPGRRLVVHGTAHSTTLALDMKRGHLVVEGHLARRQPGCRLRHHRRKATCSMRGVSAIRLGMGPGNDFVRVEQRLPVRLVAILGPGSDKFIGNGERDFCFPGGNRRNRCLGGAGDDLCESGPRNTDCVGGPGNDVCVMGTGSDGCWGGPGRDVCRMGPGSDGCHGEGGKDRLYGGSGRDRLYGGTGRDYCDGAPDRGKSQGCNAGPRG